MTTKDEALKLARDILINAKSCAKNTALVYQCDNAIAAIDSALAEPDGWRPIETAPKDFVTEFDGWNGERIAGVIWAHPEYSQKGEHAWCVPEYEGGFGWVLTRVKGLTHWRPIPAAPTTDTKEPT